MRPVLVTLALSVFLVARAAAADVRNFDDACLHAVQFVDKDEGWAVGDEGVVWHTIDGGKSWERQPTGVRASLRSLHFLTPYTGWVAGRQEQPHGGGSTGVLLFTSDGGIKWRQLTLADFPGLECIRFIDETTGYIVGDGTEQFPTGVFKTNDGGRSWKAVPGPRSGSWLAADFKDKDQGALAGAWNRMAAVQGGQVVKADLDPLGGRSVRALRMRGDLAVAAGQGGLVLLSKNSGGAWTLPRLEISPALLGSLDFHAVHIVNNHIWTVGRPGSVVVHSGDAGKTWEMLPVCQGLPLDGVFFADENNGWAVGEFGTIVGTNDGGKSWKIQRRGGQRAAVLFIHARAAGLPVETVAQLGGEEGYLAAALRVVGSDPMSASLSRSSEAQRFAATQRLAGGAAGEMLWQFPTPLHQRGDKLELLKSWDALHADHAREQLLRQLVLTLRIWQPDVVVTDHPDDKVSGYAAEALVSEAVQEAFQRAADPEAFPEQIKQLGLQPAKPTKLYASWHTRAGAQVTLDGTDVGNRLESTYRDFAGEAAGLLADVPMVLPPQRHYRLLADRMNGAAEHTSLMQGVLLGPGGVARRKLSAVAGVTPELRRALNLRRSLQGLADAPASTLSDPQKLVAQIGPALAAMPDDQAAPAAFGLATQYFRMGQWTLARETFLLMVDRYPAHPLTADALRWLIRHNSSSEARLRQELGQFVSFTKLEFHASTPDPKQKADTDNDGEPPNPLVRVDVKQERQLALLTINSETRQWYKGSLQLEPALAAFGRMTTLDPTIQFCLQASRRNTGDFEAARKWYARFVADQPEGPWRDAAAAELWLVNKSGTPPKPVLLARQVEAKPFLDGKLDDACWQEGRPMILRNAVGETAKDYATEVWMAYDKDFLYVALRCRHPAGKRVEPVKVRPRDADVRPYDRVSILLDVDRDYSTSFNLHIDQRGCLAEDCWGDLSWNPRWFVAVNSDETSWQVEAAIPFNELTSEGMKPGKAWACNVVRILPGRGVQACSLPADVTPRLEGMGLLLFGTATKAP